MICLLFLSATTQTFETKNPCDTVSPYQFGYEQCVKNRLVQLAKGCFDQLIIVLQDNQQNRDFAIEQICFALIKILSPWENPGEWGYFVFELADKMRTVKTILNSKRDALQDQRDSKLNKLLGLFSTE